MAYKKYIVLVVVLFSLLCCGVKSDGGEEPVGPSDVVVLDAENFSSFIEENPLVAVEFYSPWCGHCKSLAPEWEKAATTLKGKVPVAKVDCTANNALCGEHEVQGYPTLKLFRTGEPSVMEVARKSEAIVSFLTKELEPAVHSLKTSAELDAFLETHPLTVVAFLSNDHDDRFTAFKTVAQQKRHIVSFVAITDADWSEEKAPAIVLRKNFDEPKVVYNGEFTASAISPWVSRSLLPRLGEINGETFAGYMAAELPVGYLFVDPTTAEATNLLKELEPKLAPYKDDFAIAWINNNKYAQQAQRLGLSSKIPSIALDNQQEGIRYVFPEDQAITVDSLVEWLAQAKAGALKPFIKSEPIPESNDAPVKILVAHNFKEIVHDQTKDVLVEFYAPWCGHCKKLAPIYDELGALFTSIPSVVVAKVDATANDVPPKLNIRGFPTILFFPANNKDVPVEYQGQRTKDDLANFIHTHATTKFELPASQPSGNAADHDEL